MKDFKFVEISLDVITFYDKDHEVVQNIVLPDDVEFIDNMFNVEEERWK